MDARCPTTQARRPAPGDTCTWVMAPPETFHDKATLEAVVSQSVRCHRICAGKPRGGHASGTMFSFATPSGLNTPNTVLLLTLWRNT